MDTHTCSHNGCCEDATEKVTLWKIKPSNVSEKPVCEFHYNMRVFMEEYVPYVMFALVSIGTLVFPFNILISVLISLFCTILILPILLICTEIFRNIIKYRSKPLRTNINRVTEKNRGISRRCTKCQSEYEDGTWISISHTVELFRIPIRKKKNVKNFYCQECYISEYASDKKDRFNQSESEESLILEE